MENQREYLVSRLFSRNTIRELLENGPNLLFNNIIQNMDKEYNSNLEVIQESYKWLDKSYRNEYFYKNTLLNKLLLGVHSVNTTTALTEIPVGGAKPDFILINGKAIVYEIKTELDNFERLERQINEYYKAFDHVAIVTYMKNIDAVLRKISRIDKPVGLFILQKNNRLKTIIKPSEYRKDIDREVIFKILRKKEYENIIKCNFGELPEVSQFEYYDECKHLSYEISLDKFYLDFLKELKKRVKVKEDYFKLVPKELRFLVYFMDFKMGDYQLLKQFLYSK